jgi:HAD superfamily hydrolase (TIGR01509 family)
VSAPARVRAVLFDLDGVLVDSYEAWFAVVNDACARFGRPPVGRDRFAGIWGQGIAADVRNLYPGRTPAEVEAAYAEAMPRRAGGVRSNPEARAALERLRDAGLARALVTNTQVALAREVVSGAGLLDVLDAVQGARPGVREKPAPDLLLAALAAVGAAAAEALMVGDSRYDEEAARAAGVPFLSYDLRHGGSLLAALEARLG